MSKMVEINVFSMFAILLMMFAGNSAQDKFAARIDLVVWLPSSNEETLMREAFKSLADHFEVADDKTRVAIVSDMIRRPGAYWLDLDQYIVLNLTGDRTTFDTALAQQMERGTGHTAQTCAVNALAQYIFNSPMSLGARVVVVLTGWSTWSNLHGIKEAEKMREDGIRFYTVALKPSAGDPQGERAVERAKGYAGDPQRFFMIDSDTYGGTIDKTILDIKDAIIRDACGWTSICRYSEGQESCEPDTFQEESVTINDDDPICRKFKPTSKCSMDDCEKQCDDAWPWSVGTINCAEKNTSCDQVKFRRDTEPTKGSSMVKEKLKESCRSVEKCPPCQTEPPPPPPPPPTMDVKLIEEAKEAKQNVSQLTGIVIAVLAIVLVAVVMGVIGAVVFFQKRKAERAEAAMRQIVADQKIEALMQSVNNMSMAVSVRGIERGAAADLSEKDTKKEPSKKSGSAKSMGSGKSTGPVKKK